MKEAKDTKTWKGKMVQKFRRYGSSSAAPVEITGTFGVPLEMCPPSRCSEVGFKKKQKTNFLLK